MDAISSYRGNRPTHKHTNTQSTDGQDRLQYTAPQLSAQCNNCYIAIFTNYSD